MKLKTILLLKKDLITQRNGSSTVIFDGEKSYLYTLNQTASEILRLIQKKKSSDEIAEVISKKYDISNYKALKDINQVITTLIKNKILVKGKSERVKF